MNPFLAALIDVYTLSTGRRLFALGLVMKLAEERGFEELAAHCAMGIQHDRRTRSLENQRAAPVRRAAGAGEVQRIDLLVDRTLVAIRDIAQAQADGATGGEDDIPRKVEKLLTAIFPAGVTAVTQSPFVEELAAVEGIVASLQGEEIAPIVEELGLGRLARQLATLTVEYRAAMEAPLGPRPAFGEVKAARKQGQQNVLRAIAMILGKHHGDSAEDVAACEALLGPILQQNEAVRLYLRSRNAVLDVDPETGEVEPRAPVMTPAPAAPAPPA